MPNLLIRNETEADRPIVERVTRDAFWNLNAPSCDEHYLAHILRGHADFIPELDLVAELDGEIIGNIMYTRAGLIGESGGVRPVLTFGPVCIRPEYQRRGYGKRLLERSFERALALGHDVIVIFGDPNNYVSRGFRSCKRYGVHLENGIFPAALLVKELRPGALIAGNWVYRESPVYHIDSADAERFDARFEPREKVCLPSQEAFYIHSHAVMQ